MHTLLIVIREFTALGKFDIITIASRKWLNIAQVWLYNDDISSSQHFIWFIKKFVKMWKEAVDISLPDNIQSGWYAVTGSPILRGDVEKVMKEVTRVNELLGFLSM